MEGHKKVSNENLKALGWRQLYSAKDGFARMVRYYMEDNRKTPGTSD